MPQTKLGAKKAVETIKRKHGEDFFIRLGGLGGRAKVPKGFSMMDKDRLREVSTKGGRISRK